MTQRAAIIITNARYVEWFDQSLGHGRTVTAESSEQLLADLRRVCALALITANDNAFYGEGPGDRNAVARVRALLPEETQDE